MSAQNTKQHHVISWLKRCIKRIIWFDTKHHIFQLSILGRCVFVYMDYVIMSFKTENYSGIPDSAKKFRIDRITSENLSEFQRDDMDFHTLKNILTKYSGLCEFFGLWDENGVPAGHIGIMYKGGRDVEIYNVKNTPAHILEIFVSESSRRKGYCTQMLRYVLRYLHDKDIPRATLIVRVRNTPARLAYKKAGGTEEKHTRTFRILKLNIPLHGYDL